MKQNFKKKNNSKLPHALRGDFNNTVNPSLNYPYKGGLINVGLVGLQSPRTVRVVHNGFSSSSSFKGLSYNKSVALVSKRASCPTQSCPTQNCPTQSVGIWTLRSPKSEVFKEDLQVQKPQRVLGVLEVGSPVSWPHPLFPHIKGPHIEGSHIEGPHIKGTHIEGPHIEGPHIEGPHIKGTHIEGPHIEGPHIEGREEDLALQGFEGVNTPKFSEPLKSPKSLGFRGGKSPKSLGFRGGLWNKKNKFKDENKGIKLDEIKLDEIKLDENRQKPTNLIPRITNKFESNSYYLNHSSLIDSNLNEFSKNKFENPDSSLIPDSLLQNNNFDIHNQETNQIPLITLEQIAIIQKICFILEKLTGHKLFMQVKNHINPRTVKLDLDFLKQDLIDVISQVFWTKSRTNKQISTVTASILKELMFSQNIEKGKYKISWVTEEYGPEFLKKPINASTNKNSTSINKDNDNDSEINYFDYNQSIKRSKLAQLIEEIKILDPSIKLTSLASAKEIILKEKTITISLNEIFLKKHFHKHMILQIINTLKHK